MSLRPLSPELASLAETKFGETPEKLQTALREVKEWLEVQPHLHARTDDQWLVSFIRGCKYDLKRVKKKLDLFYTCRHTASDYYRVHHKDDMFKGLLDSGFYLPLPNLTDPAAPRVTLVRPGAIDMAGLGVVNVFAALQIIDKILQVDDDNSIISGSNVIIDLQNLNLIDLLQLTPIQMKMLIVSQQGAVPFNSVKSFFINIPEPFDVILDMMRIMFDEKIRNAMLMYMGDYEQMYTHNGMSKDIMPTEYGGNGGTLQDITDHWKRKLEDYDEWLEEDLQYGTDESRRPAGAITTEDVFGLSHNINLRKFFGP